MGSIFHSIRCGVHASTSQQSSDPYPEYSSRMERYWLDCCAGMGAGLSRSRLNYKDRVTQTPLPGSEKRNVQFLPDCEMLFCPEVQIIVFALSSYYLRREFISVVHQGGIKNEN